MIDQETVQIETALRRAKRSVQGLVQFFSPTEQETKPQVVRRVRELYRYERLSQWMFDGLFRTLLGIGNWITASAFGLRGGYLAFQQHRERFRREARYRPPIQVSEARAKRDMERLLLDKQVEWQA